eukprot:3028341-Pleurochrysis_carterae.AAC.1
MLSITMYSSTLGSSVSSSLVDWYSARRGNLDRLAEEDLRRGDELALARPLEHYKPVAGLVGRGAQVDALVGA